MGVENVLVSYLMYGGMQFIFRASNDNLYLGWTINGNCILQSLILDEREPDDTGINGAWQLNFKPIGLITSPHDISIYNYGPICEDFPNNRYLVTSIRETRILDLSIAFNVIVPSKYSKDT